MPVYIGWKCYPEKKGLVTSLIFCSNGVGTILAAIFSTLIINPDNYVPTIEVINLNIINRYYGPTVTQNVPSLFIIFASCEAVLLAIALYCIWIPPTEENDEIRMPWKV